MKTEWFADESFWEDMYPFLFPDERLEIAEEQVEKVLSLTHIKGDAVLDLACGPGRHAVVFAGKGYKVTGVDLSGYLLGKARERGTNLGLQIEWVQQDMRQFLRPDAFDLVISLFTSFGYFDDKDDDLRVLNNIRTSLKSGGAVVIDVVGKEQLARIFDPTGIKESGDGALLVERREIFDDWTRIRNEWILIKGNQAKSYKLSHTLYSGQELKDRLLAVGFRNVELFGDLDGNPYDLEARRLVAVARK